MWTQMIVRSAQVSEKRKATCDQINTVEHQVREVRLHVVKLHVWSQICDVSTICFLTTWDSCTENNGLIISSSVFLRKFGIFENAWDTAVTQLSSPLLILKSDIARSSDLGIESKKVLLAKLRSQENLEKWGKSISCGQCGGGKALNRWKALKAVV